MQEVKKLSVYFLGAPYCGALDIIKKLVGKTLDREMDFCIDGDWLPHFLKDCQEISLQLQRLVSWPVSRQADKCRAAARNGRLAGIFVVFDLFSGSSFEEAQKIIYCIKGIHVPVVLVGHLDGMAHNILGRCDYPWYEGSEYPRFKCYRREAQEFAESHGLDYIEISEVTGGNMVEMMDLVIPGAIVDI